MIRSGPASFRARLVARWRLGRSFVHVDRALELSRILDTDTREDGRRTAAWHPVALVELLVNGYPVGARNSRRLERASYDGAGDWEADPEGGTGEEGIGARALGPGRSWRWISLRQADRLGASRRRDYLRERLRRPECNSTFSWTPAASKTTAAPSGVIAGGADIQMPTRADLIRAGRVTPAAFAIPEVE